MMKTSETIGALAYISTHEKAVKNLAGGYVITCVAGPEKLGYKASFDGNADVDLAAIAVLDNMYSKYYLFDARGSDERQYSSPGLRVPMGTICKDKYYEYPEYHTSLDNLDFISADALLETMDVYIKAIDILEQNKIYVRTEPTGEPMLEKYGLYNQSNDAMRWLLFYADRSNDLLDIARNTNVPFDDLSHAADKLVKAGVLTE